MINRLTILAVTGKHSVSGAVDNRGLRMAEVLNDPSTEYLQIKNATIYRELRGTCLMRGGEVTIRKSALDFVLLDGDTHEAPLRRQHALVTKQQHSALASIGQYEIRGTLMLHKTSDLITACSRELSEFFPIIDPRVWTVGSAEEPISGGLILINKSRVSLLYFQETSESAPILVPAVSPEGVQPECQFDQPVRVAREVLDHPVIWPEPRDEHIEAAFETRSGGCSSAP